MTENTQSNLFSLFETVRTVPVDSDAEEIANKFILKTLSEIEIRTQHSERLNSTCSDIKANQPSAPYLQQVLHELSDKEKLSLEKKFDEFPVFSFISIFVRSFFAYIKEYHSLPQRIEKLIEQIQLPLFRLIISQPKIILDGNHPGFVLLNELVDYAPFWKDESKIGYPAFAKLSQILIFTGLNNLELSEQFTDVLQQVKNIKSNQQKRALIFEKRLKETELGKAKITTANNVVNQLINKIFKLDDLPEVVKSILDSAWRNLLELEFLRADDKAFKESLLLIKTLIVSLRPIKNKSSLNQLFEDLPNINRQLKVGFKKISLDNEKAEHLIAEVESLHIASISESERTISESDNLEPANTTTNDSNEILRLKPSDIFGNTEAPTEQKQANENKVELNALIDQSPLDNLFYRLELDIQSLTNEFAFESKETGIHPDTLKLIKNSQGSPWFWSLHKDKRTLHKLVLSIDNIDQHIFVNTDGNKSLSLNTNKLANKIKDKSIIPLEENNLYRDSNERYLVELEKHISDISQNQIKNATEGNQKLEDKQLEIRREPEVEIDIPKSPQRSKMDTQPTPATGLQSAINEIDISFITVGTWLKISDKNQSSRCKLAARISSKNLFIFVDRQGKKMCELTNQELINKLTNGEIELVNAELTNGKSLESIISTNRSMKN